MCAIALCNFCVTFFSILAAYMIWICMTVRKEYCNVSYPDNHIMITDHQRQRMLFCWCPDAGDLSLCGGDMTKPTLPPWYHYFTLINTRFSSLRAFMKWKAQVPGVIHRQCGVSFRVKISFWRPHWTHCMLNYNKRQSCGGCEGCGQWLESVLDITVKTDS